jgi:hypothetical protein
MGRVSPRRPTPGSAPNARARPISPFRAGIAMADIDLTIANEVIGSGHVAFAVTAILPGGRRVYEHVILHLGAVASRARSTSRPGTERSGNGALRDLPTLVIKEPSAHRRIMQVDRSPVMHPKSEA